MLPPSAVGSMGKAMVIAFGPVRAVAGGAPDSTGAGRLVAQPLAATSSTPRRRRRAELSLNGLSAEWAVIRRFIDAAFCAIVARFGAGIIVTAAGPPALFS